MSNADFKIAILKQFVEEENGKQDAEFEKMVRIIVNLSDHLEKVEARVAEQKILIDILQRQINNEGRKIDPRNYPN